MTRSLQKKYIVLYIIDFFLILIHSTSWAAIPVHERITIELDLVTEGLVAPVTGVHTGDGSNRLFIVEQTGTIRIIDNGQLLSEPFLNVRNRMVNLNRGYDERGLLGLTFHPNYAENGRFFIYYSAPGGSGNHRSIIAEYHVSSANMNLADPEETILLTIDQPESNHNGGNLAFGPDGMFYIGLGDGGGGGDEHGSIGNGQNLNTLLGKILRIDVDGQTPYSIPSDNPFVGIEGLDEIWAYGLRNPWKFSFDHLTGRLFCGDVGQNQWEEVDIIERGGNYGWRIMEGTHCYNPSSGCDPQGKILPIAEYNHQDGYSVTGGYVYRGSNFASLFGNYLFADWSGKLFLLEENDMGSWTLSEILVSDKPNYNYILGFAEDENGELFILTSNSSGPDTNSQGKLYHITVPGDQPVGIPDFPTY